MPVAAARADSGDEDYPEIEFLGSPGADAPSERRAPPGEASDASEDPPPAPSAQTPAAAELVGQGLWSLFALLDSDRRGDADGGVAVCAGTEGPIATLHRGAGRICVGVTMDGALYVDDALRAAAPALADRLSLPRAREHLESLPVGLSDIAALKDLTARALRALALRIGRRSFTLEPCAAPPPPPLQLRFPVLELFLLAARETLSSQKDVAASVYDLARLQVEDAWLFARQGASGAELVPVATEPVFDSAKQRGAPFIDSAQRSGALFIEKDVGYAHAAVASVSAMARFLREVGRTAEEMQDFLQEERALFGVTGELLRLSFQRPPLLLCRCGGGLWSLLAGPEHVSLLRSRAALLGRLHGLELATEEDAEFGAAQAPAFHATPAGVVPMRFSELPTQPKQLAVDSAQRSEAPSIDVAEATAPSATTAPLPAPDREPPRPHVGLTAEDAVRVVSALGRALDEIPACVAAGLVDAPSGTVLAVKQVDAHPRELWALAAVAAALLCQDRHVSAIEREFKQHRGLRDDGDPQVRELVILSDQLTHAVVRCKKDRDRLLVVVCHRSPDVGPVLHGCRRSVAALEASLAERPSG